MVLLIVGGGITIVIIPAITPDKPYLKYDDTFPAVLHLDNDKKGELHIQLHGSNGLMPYRGVEAEVKIKIPESVNNTSSFELIFTNARLLNPNDNPYIAMEDKLVEFEYLESDSKTSTYVARPLLVYYHTGVYGADLKINTENIPIYEKQYDTVIEIGSWESYLAEQEEKTMKNLTWYVLGISLITTAPAWIKILDLFYQKKKLKEEKFYS